MLKINIWQRFVDLKLHEISVNDDWTPWYIQNLEALKRFKMEFWEDSCDHIISNVCIVFLSVNSLAFLLRTLYFLLPIKHIYIYMADYLCLSISIFHFLFKNIGQISTNWQSYETIKICINGKIKFKNISK